MNSKKLKKTLTQKALREKGLKERYDAELAKCETDEEKEELKQKYLALLEVEQEQFYKVVGFN